MAIPRIPAISVEYLQVPITGPVELGELTVELAVVPDGQTPDTGDWKAGAWIGSNASVLIGPGATIPLTRGTYDVYVKITSDQEIPVLLSGSIHIT